MSLSDTQTERADADKKRMARSCTSHLAGRRTAPVGVFGVLS